MTTATEKMNTEQVDFASMSRIDALWEHGIPATVHQMKRIMKRRYEYGYESRKWSLWLIGESGVGKNHLQEQVAEELDIAYLWFPCKGIASEDIRGFPMPVRTIGNDSDSDRYTGDIQGIVHILRDYYTEEPEYKFQLMQHLEQAFDPGWQGIIHFDEFAQASKEVQEILYMLFYDRRLDNKRLSDGAMIVISMNPPSQSEYMLKKIGKAAQDRSSIFIIKPTASEWIQWAKKNNLHPTLIDFVTDYTTVFEINKGRALHRFSDILTSFGTIDPANIPKDLKVEAYANITIDSADQFARYLKEIFDISGVALLNGNTDQFDKLKKMLKTSAKTVYLYRIQKEMMAALKEPETYMASLWSQYGADEQSAWDVVVGRILQYFTLLQKTDMDSVIGFLKEITKVNNALLEDSFDRAMNKEEHRYLQEEIDRCMHVSTPPPPETVPETQKTETPMKAHSQT